MSNLKTNILGFPRIGRKRELKRALESYWNGEISFKELEATAKGLKKNNWLLQKSKGIDLIPSNDFCYYDQVLDTTALVGNIPKRFKPFAEREDLEFLIARGLVSHGECGCGSSHQGEKASDMTKWFDTNYHYIVPEFSPETTFTLTKNKPLTEYQEAEALGVKTKPVLIGPFTYLQLGKNEAGVSKDFDRWELLDSLVEAYAQILASLSEAGVEWVQFDEPIFSLDPVPALEKRVVEVYRSLKQAAGETKLLVANYFGALGPNLELFSQIPVDGLHIDAHRAPQEAVEVAKLAGDKHLSLGLVSGREIWRVNETKARSLINAISAVFPREKLWVATSCSLLHVPHTIEDEVSLEKALKSKIAFAYEKLDEVTDLAKPVDKVDEIATQGIETPASVTQSLDERAFRRLSDYPQRKVAQQKLGFPLFPTTTIGSFPQTTEIRQVRAKFRKGELSLEEYERAMEKEIEYVIREQEALGLDVLVHGEPERNDMVEYFGEQLDGFAFTKNGWVQSYGSRCVKPPIIWQDVKRPQPMTVRWAKYAQSLTSKHVKGMLTGPVTILQWSFVRDDLSRSEVTYQIALAIREEVKDLEQAGIAVIQIDEPAIREGLPLRKTEWPEYLDWAVKAFRLATSGVKDETQIHTHMCYSEFNDIIESITALDADVITIEASRSQMSILDAFEHFSYPNGIGPGVWDIHSPRIPSVEEMVKLLEKALKYIGRRELWANPDCGLKTRRWPEVRESLHNLVQAAEIVRERVERDSLASV